MNFQKLSGGKFSTTYLLNIEEQKYVLRVSPPDNYLLLFYERRMMRQEPDIHEKILSSINIPIPRILFYDFTRNIIDRDYLIMEYLSGSTLADMQYKITKQAYNRCLYEWGAYIHELHTITTDKYGYIGEHKPMIPQDRWDDAFSIMWRKLIDDIVGCGIYSDRERTFALKLLDRYLHLFPSHPKSSLLHMDIWVTNVLIDNKGKVTGIIDFDRACWGDCEIEYSIISYCGISQPPFWEGYGSYPEDTYESRIRFMFYTLYEHQKYIVIRMSERHNRDINSALMYKRDCLAMMEKLNG